MTSTKRLLLGTAAATIAAAGGGTAQAADIMVKKAPPIQYVRICDMYGARYFQIPGTTVCIALRGSLQVDQAFQPTRTAMIVTQSGGHYNETLFTGGQIEQWGYEVNAKPRMDIKQETSWGTFRAYVELKTAYDAGNFSAISGPSGGSTAKSAQLYRGYFQWAGWTIGYAPYPFCQGGYNDDDLQNITTSEKCSGWTTAYTWTPTGPGQPPKKGTAPFPGGWSLYGGVDWPLDVRSRGLNGGTNLPSLILGPGSPAGNGFVTLHDGTIGAPDLEAQVHYEGDPAGTTPGFNDQFGLATFQLAGFWHNLQATTSVPVPGIPAQICSPVATCSFPLGPTDRATGWAVNGGFRIFTPMWGGANAGAIRQPDYIWLYADYANGAATPIGIGGGAGNLTAGDAYATMGFMRDDLDARWVNNGNGSFYADKEKFLVFNASYHHIITDCTDPVYCWRMNLAFNWARATPGSITRNTDWTMGGLGEGTIKRVTLNFIWGADVQGTAKPTLGELSFEVQYNIVNQDLPNNCNGGSAVCGPITPLPVGVAQNPSNWVGRLTYSRGW
jgi:hypothetical protein